ncbi:uncharacterized protein LOC111089938 [Limulus polyphemus]|uniref:Uncharacterized protein LOC111089938 n=1 Tax=Limulus polyphemus TaxID=6850 RepID=A0ABM1TSU0_LIMPO|nr:uncharacterized protein LOC111089938 [Limulus polyphemus]
MLIVAPKYQHIHVKFLGLSTGPEGSITVFMSHENTQPVWYIAPNSSTTEDIPPVFISHQRFMLLKFHSCAECNVSATFYSLGGTNGCNETVNHSSGSFESTRFSEVDYTPKDCFYCILAPYGDHILLSIVQYGDSSELNLENFTENVLQVYGALGNKVFKFSGGLSSGETNHNLISQRNSLFLYIHSNSGLNNTGFVLNYTTVPACVHSNNFEGSLCSREIFNIFHKRTSCLFIFDVLSEYNIEIGFPLASRNDGKTFSCGEDFIEVLTEKTLVKLCINSTNQSESLMFHSVRAWMFVRVYLKRYSLLTTSSGVFCVKYKTAALITSSEICQYPWVARGYYCYSLFEQSMTWENASSYCLDKGGHLVTISDFETQQVVEELIRSKWVNLSNMA